MHRFVRKRTGELESFQPRKIEHAIQKAAIAIGISKEEARRIAKAVTRDISKQLQKEFFDRKKIPSVEQIQDKVIALLKKKKYIRLANEYSAYRKKKAELRKIKQELGLPLEPKLTVNALEVLKARYLLKDETGKIIETPKQLFMRVATAVARADKRYGKNPKNAEKTFFSMMAKLEFLPNSPTLFNAGTPMGQLSACFVLPIEDSLESIFTTLKHMALIEQTGGGVGFTFTKLRPRGDIVKSTKGVASGPVSFMRVYNIATEVIKAGGKRRGAMMGILRIDHPDIVEFITAKNIPGILDNFNISVAVSDEFMSAVKRNADYKLINPRTGKPVRKLNARKIWRLIAENAWRTGDPGAIFIDEINRHNPTPSIGRIESTNPCLTEDCWITTSEGPRQIKELLSESIKIILNNEEFLAQPFFKTGNKKTFRLITKEGFEIEATENHLFLKVSKLTRYTEKTEWTELKNLKSGDKLKLSYNLKKWNGKGTEEEGYLLGLLIGDGHITKEKARICIWLKDTGSEGMKSAVEKAIFKLTGNKKPWFKIKEYFVCSKAIIKHIAKRFSITYKKKEVTDEIEKASYPFYVGFLRGFFDCDGSVQGNQKKGISIRLTQTNLNNLKRIQRMLLRLGIFSRIYQNRKKTEWKLMPNGKGGKKLYKTKPVHELVISNENLILFDKIIGFNHTKKKQRLKSLLKLYKRRLNKERYIVTVSKIIPQKRKEVFDTIVSDVHAFEANGFIVHNCGEQPLLPYESCNLGSINLTKFVSNGKIDWEKLRITVRNAVHFLDNVIDVNKFPLKQIKEMTLANRKIGLGIMGWAEMLIMLGIKYDSQKALQLAEKLMKFISTTAREKSIELAEERGSFPNFDKSIWADRYKALRNATCTTIAPTGSISIIAGCSSGIEPLFAISFMREVLGGKRLFEVNPLFERIAKKRGFYSADLLDKIAKTGSLQNIAKIPKDVKQLFRTAFDIAPEWHVRMQAAFQRYTDNAVSKTINLPTKATIDDVQKAYELAYKLKCKGITVYRYGSKPKQVLYFAKPPKEKYVVAKAEYAGGCPGVCPH